MKFKFSEDFVVDSDVEPWRREGLRVAMLGGPGSGKSWNNSLIAEQFLTQGGTVVIFQPRDEYFTLKEKFDVLSVGGVHAKDMEFALTSPSIYAKAVVEDGISMIFYTSAAEDEEKLINWVSTFIRHVLNYQESHKRPLLLILEEAQEYAPRTASGHVAPPWVYNRMVKAFKDCFTQGRKLNIIAIASSQRPQELNFTIRQLANLTFYGKFAAQDINYIDKECLKYVRKRIELIGDEVIVKLIDASRLVDLKLGEWLVIRGKDTGFVTVTEPRLTKHGAETPRLEYVAPRTSQATKTIDELTKTIIEALKKEEAEKSELEKAKRKNRELTKKLEAAEKKAEIKLSVKEMLEGGGGAPELAEKLAEAQTQLDALNEKCEALTEQVMETEALREAAEDRVAIVMEEKNKELAQFKRDHELVENLQKALAPFLPTQPAGPPGFEPGSRKIGLQSMTTILDVPDKEKVAVITTDTIRGKVLKLAKTGFLDKWCRLGDVHKGLIEKFGWTLSKASLHRELNRMVDDFLLGAKRDPGRKQRVYHLAANVKFKEAES